MKLETVVTASMLPASRLGVAAAFRALYARSGSRAEFLDLLWSAVVRSGHLAPAVLAELQAAASHALDEGRRLGIAPIPLCEPGYPALLWCIAEPPPVLWVRGERGLLSKPAVAIVGSRTATPYALQVAERLAAELAGRGIVVVSGLARGVDSAAHRGCLGAGGPTVAVLGSGVDRVYPPEHDDLAARIAGTGLVASELAPGAAPLPEHFPLRNRIISGLSLATVVVEASERSGSLITARYALEQGRDVMVVPGSVLSGRNRGSHALLKDGAAVVESADDILQQLGWNQARRGGPPPDAPDEPVLAAMVPGEPCGLDELAGATGLSGDRILARLTELELAGAVTAAGGRYIRRR